MFSIIQAAGWPIWPLLLCSVVALALIIERVVSLRAARVAPPSLIEEVLGVTQLQIPSGEVVGKLAENSLLGQVLAAGLRTSQADPRAGEARLRQSFELAGRHAIHQMERYLNTLGTIAAAAPLLGSQSPGPGGNNPALLAHGISIALYNTAFGLVVAIPSLMFYRYFRGRIESYVVDMEQASERLLTHLVNRAMPAGGHAAHAGPVTVPPPVAAPVPGKAKA